MQYPCYATVFAGLFVLRLSNAVTHDITHAKFQCDGKEKASALLDVANDFINKSKNLFPDCIDDDFQCGKKEKSLAFLEVASNLITGAKKSFPTCPETECPTVPEPECPTVLEPECPTVPEPECPTVPEPECQTVPETKCPTCPTIHQPDCTTISQPECPTVPEPECPKVLQKVPMDCSEILHSVKSTSGVYTIWPGGRKTTGKGLSVYCDMDTDGGGWTVIQRRGQFSTEPKENFYRDWASYKKGFGNLTEEFWLGNDNIHVISNQANYTILFDLKDGKGERGYARYDTFRIEDELSQYTLRISGYNGNVNDSMRSHNNMKFSTKDRRNENKQEPVPCAEKENGAWWYNSGNCGLSNLNALNQPGVNGLKGIYWYHWRKLNCLSGVEMKLRPRNYGNKN